MTNHHVGGGGEVVWVGGTKGRLYELDFPSAKFWVKIFFGRVGLRLFVCVLPFVAFAFRLFFRGRFVCMYALSWIAL